MLEILMIVLAILVIVVSYFVLKDPLHIALVGVAMLFVIAFSMYLATDTTTVASALLVGNGLIYDVEKLNILKSYAVIGPENDPLTPELMRTVYLKPVRWNGGAGLKIAIISCYNHRYLQRDLDAFCTKYQLPSTNLKILSFGTRSSSDWSVETSLDVQWSHVMAPRATIHVIQASTASYGALKQALEWTIDEVKPNIISMSLGSNEYLDVINYMEPTFQRAKDNNIIVMAASGDYQAVSYPSSSSNIISVGGTNILVAPDGTNNSRTPVLADYNNQIFNKIGETAWASPNGVGTGHGISKYIDAPFYQSGHTHCANRSTPDLSLAAAAYSGNGFSAYCNGYWYGVSGTSVSCPMLAGIVATANATRGSNWTTSDLMQHIYDQIPKDMAVETSVDQAGYVGRNFVELLVMW